MIKRLATILVGMFMLLWTPPLAWSVGERAGGVGTGEETAGAQEESQKEDRSTNTSSALEATISGDSFNEIGRFDAALTAITGTGNTPVTSEDSEGVELTPGNVNIKEESDAVQNQDNTFTGEITVNPVRVYGTNGDSGTNFFVEAKVDNGFNGTVILINKGATVEVGQNETLFLSMGSTINSGKVVKNLGTINSGGVLFDSCEDTINASELVFDEFNTINSTTTEAAIQIDGSNIITGGVFTSTGSSHFAGPLANIENAIINGSDIFRVSAGGTVTSTTSEALYHVKESNLSLDSIMAILGGEVNINGELGHFENTDVTTTFDALSIANDGKLKTNDPDKPVLRIEGGTWKIGEDGLGSLVNLSGTVAPPAGGPGAGDPGAGDPGAGDPGADDPGAGDPGAGGPGAGGPAAADPTSRPIEGTSPSGHAFEATGGADISIERNAVTVDSALWEAMKLAVVGAVGDPLTKITTANSFMEASNSKIEFFQPTHLTNALINVTKGDFLTVSGGTMIFHNDFLRMNNAEIQVVDGFLINVLNGGNLDIKGKLAVGTGGVNTIVVNNTSPVTGIQNGISFTRDLTSTVQIGANPVEGVNLDVTGSMINAGLNSSVKINTP